MDGDIFALNLYGRRNTLLEKVLSSKSYLQSRLWAINTSKNRSYIHIFGKNNPIKHSHIRKEFSNSHHFHLPPSSA
jgi:hypothetical protein